MHSGMSAAVFIASMLMFMTGTLLSLSSVQLFHDKQSALKRFDQACIVF